MSGGGTGTGTLRTTKHTAELRRFFFIPLLALGLSLSLPVPRPASCLASSWHGTLRSSLRGKRASLQVCAPPGLRISDSSIVPGIAESADSSESPKSSFDEDEDTFRGCWTGVVLASRRGVVAGGSDRHREKKKQTKNDLLLE